MMPSTGNRADNQLHVWLWRLWMGAALLYACEILLWRDPLERAALEWGALALGYTLVGTLALDVAVRFRVRDALGMMAVALIVSAAIALTLTPHDVFVELPENMLSRMVGAYGLMTLAAFGLLILLIGGAEGRHRRALIGFGFAGGVLSGAWTREAHILTRWNDTPATLPELLILHVVYLLVLALAGWILLRRSPGSAGDLRLSAGGLAALAVVLAALVFGHIVRGQFVGGDLLGAVAFGGVGWLILWFERSDKGKSMFDRLLPSSPPPSAWIVWGVMALVIGQVGGWIGPDFRIGELTPSSLVEIGFVSVGFGWVPFLAVVIATRTLERESRKLDSL